MTSRTVLGFPRMGVNRDLKKATEAYWGGKLSQDELLAEGKRIRLAHWKIQKEAGLDIIPSNDFSFYDHVLDHIQLFGVSPPPSYARGSCAFAYRDWYRLCPRDIPSTSSLLLMNSSPWVVVGRNPRKTVLPRLTCQAW